MSSAGEESVAEVRPAGEHDRLVRQASERSVVLGRVMQLVVQDIWRGLAAAAEACPGASPESARGSRRAFGEPQYHLLHVLAPVGSLTVGEIAGRCHVSAPTISKMLNLLETRGLIERHLDPGNRRVVHVVLTDDGRAAQSRMETRIKAAFARVFSPLTDAQLEDLIAAFGHLERLVDAEDST